MKLTRRQAIASLVAPLIITGSTDVLAGTFTEVGWSKPEEWYIYTPEDVGEPFVRPPNYRFVPVGRYEIVSVSRSNV